MLPFTPPTLVFVLILGSVVQAQSDWTSWRGPKHTGSIESGNYPAKLDASTLQWKTPLPGKGCSTPIVLNRRIYVTAPINGVDALLAFDGNGQELWHARFGKQDPGKHRNGSGSNASPVSDGKAVFVYFKSGTLAAVELDGNTRWSTNLVERFGKDTLFWDHGTSPVLTEKFVVMTRMHRGESWLAGFDKETGKIAWKESRNYETGMENDHGYTTPLVIQYQGQEALLLWGAEHLTIHRSSDGKLIWSCAGFNPESQKMWPAIATPVIVDDTAVIAFGRNDKRQPRLFGVRLDGNGDVTSTNHAWHRKDTSTFVPTPVAYQGKVYLVRDRGEVECIEPETGETIWNAAFPRSSAAFYASPLIAAGKLYAAREDGVVFVADVAGGQFTLLSENDLGQPVIGSPVPTANRILVRGEDHLFCFAAPGETQ